MNTPPAVRLRPTRAGVAKQTAIYGTLLAFAPVGFSLLTGQLALGIGYAIANFVVVGAVFALIAASGRQDLSVTADGIEVGGLLGRRTIGWSDVARIQLQPRGQQVWIKRRSDKGKEPVVIAPFIYDTNAPELHDLLVLHQATIVDRRGQGQRG